MMLPTYLRRRTICDGRSGSNKTSKGPVHTRFVKTGLLVAYKRTAKFWKDWIASRIVPDLKAEFSAIGELLHIRDCVE